VQAPRCAALAVITSCGDSDSFCPVDVASVEPVEMEAVNHSADGRQSLLQAGIPAYLHVNAAATITTNCNCTAHMGEACNVCKTVRPCELTLNL